jgi:hypothetical protein
MSSFSTDDVPKVDANTKSDTPLFGYVGLAVEHPALHLGGAADRVDDAREFHQHAVAGIFDDAPVILLDLRIDQLLEMRLKAFIRAFFVSAHQARIAGHIGGENCCETARRGRWFAARHRCDKAVAAPCDRLYAAPLRSPVIEDAAQRCDLDVEVAVFDRRPRPDGVYDVGSRDQIPGRSTSTPRMSRAHEPIAIGANTPRSSRR